MPIIACGFAAWAVVSVLLSVAVRRVTRHGGAERQDQVFVRQFARQVSLSTSAIDVLLRAKP